MDKALEGLKPELLWRHFDEIRRIPRCSKNEGKIREYVIKFAREKALEYEVDEVGNVLIRKKATPGHEGAPTVVLQAHLDMVCEKNSDVDFDFEKDAIRIKREDGWITAEGTTLGADNGIGVAAALAVLEDDSIVHGPLEVLLTVDEETGLTGASNLKPNWLRGKYLLNLDSEDEGVFFIGCAGGRDTVLKIPVSRKDRKGTAFEIKVSGLKGGHSGVDIHLQRGNAIRILARVLYEIDGAEIAEIHGGNKRNAIPREAKAIVFAPEEKVKEAVEKVLAEVREELKYSDPEVKIEYSPSQASRAIAESKRIIDFLMALPHGVLAMSLAMEGLVETSTNLAVVKTGEGEVEVVESSRSSVNSSLEFVCKQLRALGDLAGVQTHQPPGYPGWTPNPDSELLSKMKEIYRRLFGKEPEVTAIHAGLETGIIGKNYPNMEMISFGPTIRFPHSPDEKVEIASVEKFWRLLVETLRELAG